MRPRTARRNAHAMPRLMGPWQLAQLVGRGTKGDTHHPRPYASAYANTDQTYLWRHAAEWHATRWPVHCRRRSHSGTAVRRGACGSEKEGARRSCHMASLHRPERPQPADPVSSVQGPKGGGPRVAPGKHNCRHAHLLQSTTMIPLGLKKQDPCQRYTPYFLLYPPVCA